MSRTLRALVIVLLAASCGGGGGDFSAPRDLDNACAILTERPHYTRAFRAAERKWGVPMHVQMATIYQESKFIGNARTPFRYTLGVIPMGRQSSAFGYSQALDGTWDEYLEETGNRRAKRDDIRDATDFMGWYMAKSRDSLGLQMYDARNHYLAYHEGRTGYSRGSYNSKAWLVRVAGEVDNRSRLYQAQLASCRAAR
ncbi:lytic transglycosylase [Thalassococcus profundi]|uniref:Lytic transglycosylase n=1 Tax=Thalassococcus profundi TaxID=2282382 RepID=A0A369TR33_9RHOB|nr:lytic transglycosylase [Thalassococcus profundi]RDD67718.1 lytic transglycosylase [Thalassococcus profundi]